MPLRILLAVLVALVGPTSPAWATGPQFGPMSGGSGGGVTANSCTVPGDFATGIAADGTLTCSTPAGSGDITAVGDCATGACFDGTTGNSLTFEGATADTIETILTAADPTASDKTITLPNASGTVAVSATSPLALSAAGDLSITADGIGSSQLAATFTATTITSNLVGNVTGNADTATALAANPTDCGADTYATTIAASGNLTCSTVTNAGLAGSIAMSKTLLTADAGLVLSTNSLATASSETGFITGSTSLPGTCGEGAVYQDTDSGGTETYTCTAANTWTKYVAATDNVATSTALAANPSDCGVDTYATTIDASGNLTCATVTSAGITNGAIVNADVNASAAIDVSKTALVAGAGLALSTNTLSTDSTEANFLGNAASLTCSASAGKLIVDSTTDTLSYCSSGGSTVKYAALGNDSGQATLINATSCTYGVQTASDGTPSCLSATSSPEYVSRTMTAGGTVAAYGVVAKDGSTGDQVIEAATTVTQILGCSQSGSSVTATNPLEVAVGGIARCKADATVAAGSLVKLGASGEFSLATTADKTWGRAVTDDDGAGSAYILLFDGAEGYIDHTIDVWSSIPDITTASTSDAINFSPTVDISGTGGQLIGFHFQPTTSATDGGDLTGMKFQPALTVNGIAKASDLQAVWSTGTVGVSQATNLSSAYVLRYDTAFTSSTANSVPVFASYGLYDWPTMTTTASSGSATASVYAAASHNPTIVLNSGGGATATFSLTEDLGLKMTGSYTKTAGTALNVTTRAGLQYNEVTTSGTVALTDNVAVDVKALTKGGTTNAALRSAVASGAANYFLKDDGGAQSKFTGKITTYNNIATAGFGMGIIVADSGVSATKTANFTSTSFTPPATAGAYRGSWIITTTSGTNTGTVQCTIDYVDSQGTTHTADIIPMASAAGTFGTTGTAASKQFHCGPWPFNINNAGTAIAMKVVITGSVNYTVQTILEQVG